MNLHLEEVDKTVDSLRKIDGNVAMTMYEMNQQIISQLPAHKWDDYPCNQV